MAEYKIEKNIAITKFNAGRQRVYPFADMEVGDSFLVRKTKKSSAASSALNYGRKFGVEFSTRTMEDGVRIWRTK